MKSIIKGNTASIINHAFQILLVTYLILLLVEQIWTGVVSIYLNLNFLLIAVIVAGVLDVFSEHSPLIQKKPTKFDYLFIFALGILGFAIIKIKTSDLQWLSWLISSIAGILIILLSILVLEEENDDKTD
jgi:predicted membrane channel-forming protein YqfA (hemolysin III family)